jgi:hypothetical protein
MAPYAFGSNPAHGLGLAVTGNGGYLAYMDDCCCAPPPLNLSGNKKRIVFGMGWPDLIVATIMAALGMQGAALVIRQAIRELRFGHLIEAE